jgi:hypothetical protein
MGVSTELEELITLYNSAWSEPDRRLRQQILERVWAEDGTYTDPTEHVANRSELVDHLAGFMDQFPGARLALTSGIDTHHDNFRFSWRMLLADGKVFVEGTDFGKLCPDGKVNRIVGFFGPLPPGP